MIIREIHKSGDPGVDVLSQIIITQLNKNNLLTVKTFDLKFRFADALSEV